MDSSDCFILRVDLSKPDNHFAIVKSVWTAVSLQLQVAQFENIADGAELRSEYEAALDASDLQQQADNFEWPLDELVAKWKTSLSIAGDFSYEIADDQLQWHRCGGVRVRYGCIRLTDAKPKFKLCTSLLLESIGKQSTLAKECEDKWAELQSKKEHFADMKAVYEQHMDQQKANEDRRLVQFVALINEKKARIKQLEKELSIANDHNRREKQPESDVSEINSTLDDFIELPKRPWVDDAKPSTSRHQCNDAADAIYDQDTQAFVESDELRVGS